MSRTIRDILLYDADSPNILGHINAPEGINLNTTISHAHKLVIEGIDKGELDLALNRIIVTCLTMGNNCGRMQLIEELDIK